MPRETIALTGVFHFPMVDCVPLGTVTEALVGSHQPDMRRR